MRVVTHGPAVCRRSVHVLCFFFFFQAEDGIRDWSVTGVQTCALPIFVSSWPAQIDRFNIFLHFDTTMIRCAVPEQNEALVWVVLAKIFNKDGCPITIRCLGWNHDGITRKRFDRTVIGLSLTKIGHRDFDPLCAWSPDIATCIIPD